MFLCSAAQPAQYQKGCVLQKSFLFFFLQQLYIYGKLGCFTPLLFRPSSPPRPPGSPVLSLPFLCSVFFFGGGGCRWKEALEILREMEAMDNVTVS